MFGCFKTQFPATLLPSTAFWYSTEETALGNMASWTERIAANNATQGTAANQPVNTNNIIGGKPSLLFDGVNDNLSAASNSINTNLFATGGTIAGVFRPTGAGGLNFGRILDKSNGTTSGFGLIFVGAPQFFLRFQIFFSGGSSIWNTPVNSVIYNTSYFFIVTYNSSSVLNDATIYLNSATPQALTISRATGTVNSDVANAMLIGNRIGIDRTFNGYISEVMGFRTILNATQISQLITYFRNNWGL